MRKSECGSGNRKEVGSWKAEVGKKEGEKMRRCEGRRRNESIADWRGKAQ